MKILICTFQPEGVRHMYVLDCSRIGRDIFANCFCSCEQDCSRDEWIYSPVASIWPTRMCDIPGAHLQGSKTWNGRDIGAEPQLISSLVTCAVQGLSAFIPLLLRTRNPSFALFEAHTLLGWTAHIQKIIRSDCFCSCKLRCCRAEFVLLLGFNVQCDTFADIIAWS